jgi:hypothetical protein
MIFGVAPRLTDETLTRVELARLEGTVSALVKELQAFRESIGAQYIDHEHRIRVNERWRLTMPPTVLTSIVAFVVSVWHH